MQLGFCKQCGSYHIIFWGCYKRNIRHMYADTEHVRVKRFRCKTCKKTFTASPEGVKKFKRFANKDYQEMVDQRCSRGSGYRRLSRRGKIKYCSHITMWRQMQKVGQQTLDAFFDVEYLVADDSVIQKVFNKVYPDAIKAKEEILNIFNAKTSDEAIRRLAILVERRHTLPWMAQGVVNRLVSKIEGLFQYLDHDILKTSNQAEQTFSLFQPIIDAGKSFSTGVGNFFRTFRFDV